LRIAGERALEYAMDLWRQDVYDPRVSDNTENAKRCKAIIRDIIKRNGWLRAARRRVPRQRSAAVVHDVRW
jgi:hypothetical protein